MSKPTIKQKDVTAINRLFKLRQRVLDGKASDSEIVDSLMGIMVKLGFEDEPFGPGDRD